ncbi:hypothetical protein [Pararhodobacter zhoushanensis]|uniref:Uncharacterized protein n=1 Tax=Pararhodobacter zhoushanensis TaxID=2479545 RepID=A0ABT3GUD4_9RHOB|nr:hypothetical protein [Pararhodobacter zhoushanensis]MCW1931125.1 hypothetical protein [Pararhodobacter zhoushanensis]
MNDLLNNIAGTGTLTTLGGLVLFGFCVANYYGKPQRRRNWLLFAPFIQAYVVVGAYIVLIGFRVSTSFPETVVFVSFSSIISSVAVCGVIHLNTSYVKAQRNIPLSPKNVIFRLVLPLGALIAMAILMVSSTFSGYDCLSDLRCRIYSKTIGLPGYAGTLLLPAFMIGVCAVLAYFAVFFTIFKEVKSQP